MIEGPGKTNIELQLSPEQIERVMDKVQDINAKGTAFTGILPTSTREQGPITMYVAGSYLREITTKMKDRAIDKLPSILRDGLLGLPDDHSITKANAEERKRAWHDSLRNLKLSGAVHFQILGRSERGFGPAVLRSIKEATYFTSFAPKDHLNITLLLDMKSFSENPAASGVKYDKNGKRFYKQRTHTFSAHDTGPLNEEGLSKVDEDYGFIASHRVAPRLFRGVVCEAKSIESEKYIEQVKKVILNTYKNKPELLLPIYDIDGNLLWPKQMSYEEVQKLVAERQKINTTP